jgi:hypothetical protein
MDTDSLLWKGRDFSEDSCVRQRAGLYGDLKSLL